MPRKYLVAMLLMFVFVFSAVVLAFAEEQPQPPPQPPPNYQPQPPNPQVQMMMQRRQQMMTQRRKMMMMRRNPLEHLQPPLTEAQKQAILDLKINLIKELTPMISDLKIKNLQLAQLVKSRNFLENEEKILALAQEKDALKNKIKELHGKYKFNVLRVLTPAQREDLLKKFKYLIAVPL